MSALGCPQALSRVLPLRVFFLLPQNYSSCKSVLVQRFGALLRKTWNPRQFKGQVRLFGHVQACMSSFTCPKGQAYGPATWRMQCQTEMC